MWRFHFPRDTAGLKAELGVEFPRQLLHAPVLGEAKHMQPLDLAVAGREQHTFEQLRSHAMALPSILDAECCFRLACGFEQAQLGRTAQHAVDKEPVNERAAQRGGLGIPPDEVVGNHAAEAIAPTSGVEAQQVLAVKLGFANPQPADSATGYQRLVHWMS